MALLILRNFPETSLQPREICQVNTKTISLLLADDDVDDCLLFSDAISELPVSIELTTVNDGEQLMKTLKEKKEKLPSILFLDLNMPKKNGWECLTEIKVDQDFQNMPVVIISTSFNLDSVQNLHKEGADHYVRKPNQFSTLKNLIFKTLRCIENRQPGKLSFENFVIHPE